MCLGIGGACVGYGGEYLGIGSDWVARGMCNKTVYIHQVHSCSVIHIPIDNSHTPYRFPLMEGITAGGGHIAKLLLKKRAGKCMV